MVRTRQPTIERALEVVEAEIELVSTERDAFERFLSRLHEVQPAGRETVTTDAGPAAMATTEPTVSSGIERIRRAYRETVMAVPHYEREYGDTLAGSLSAEVGAPLARHVADGAGLPPSVYRSLVEATERTHSQRGEFIGVLERERDSLQSAASDLDAIERRVVELGRAIPDASSDDLSTLDRKLARMETRCTDLANRRAELIHNRSVREISGTEGVSLLQYLYGDAETATPALSDVADCLDTVRRQRERCLR